MGSVEQHTYPDNQQQQEVIENINREKRLQRAFLDQQRQLGKIRDAPPTPQKARPSLSEKFGLPAHFEAIRACPNLSETWTTGMELAANVLPGYHVRDAAASVSTMKTDFLWDESEVAVMRRMNMLAKPFNRRRDEQTKFAEALACHDARSRRRE